MPQLPNNLSNTGIQMIVCGLQALVQVPQHALHRRIYCRPQKVPHVKGPQIQELVLSQKSRPKQKPGSPNPLWGCLPTPKMELPMTPQGDLSIFPSMLSVLYHSLRGIPSLWGYENLKITALSIISTGLDRCACKEPLVPSTWTKCSSRHLSSLSIMWKVKQDPFFLQTLEDFIISILPPIIGDLDSTRVVVEVFSKSTFITWQSCEVWYFCNEMVPTTPKFRYAQNRAFSFRSTLKLVS